MCGASSWAVILPMPAHLSIAFNQTVRTQGPTPGRRHEMSCFVMRGPRDVVMCHVSSWSGGWRSGSSVRFPVFATVSPFRPSSLRPPRRRAERGGHCRWRRLRRRPVALRGGTLFRAYRAPARRRALAPARFARLIAPAPMRASRTQGALRPLAESRAFFRAGADAGGSGLRMLLPTFVPYIF